MDEWSAAAIDRGPLSDFADDQLLAAAKALAEQQNSSRISRRLPNLGLEFLARRLDIPEGS